MGMATVTRLGTWREGRRPRLMGGWVGAIGGCGRVESEGPAGCENGDVRSMYCNLSQLVKLP